MTFWGGPTNLVSQIFSLRYLNVFADWGINQMREFDIEDLWFHYDPRWCIFASENTLYTECVDSPVFAHDAKPLFMRNFIATQTTEQWLTAPSHASSCVSKSYKWSGELKAKKVLYRIFSWRCERQVFIWYIRLKYILTICSSRLAKPFVKWYFQIKIDNKPMMRSELKFKRKWLGPHSAKIWSEFQRPQTTWQWWWMSGSGRPLRQGGRIRENDYIWRSMDYQTTLEEGVEICTIMDGKRGENVSKKGGKVGKKGCRLDNDGWPTPSPRADVNARNRWRGECWG